MHVLPAQQHPGAAFQPDLGGDRLHRQASLQGVELLCELIPSPRERLTRRRLRHPQELVRACCREEGPALAEDLVAGFALRIEDSPRLLSDTADKARAPHNQRGGADRVGIGPPEASIEARAQ
jgi:hypothetical protein